MEKELPQIAREIEELSVQIKNRLKQEEEYYIEAVNAEVKFDEEMAKATAALALGAEFTIAGQEIKDLGATSRDRLVKGICAKWLGEKLIAKAKHRRLNEQIDELQARRISKQSILKRFDET